MVEPTSVTVVPGAMKEAPELPAAPAGPAKPSVAPPMIDAAATAAAAGQRCRMEPRRWVDRCMTSSLPAVGPWLGPASGDYGRGRLRDCRRPGSWAANF